MWEQFHPIPQKASPSPSKGGKTTSPLSSLQPHPRPLSEWRGEWIVLFAYEREVTSRDRRPRLSAFTLPLVVPLGTSPPSEGLGEAFVSCVFAKQRGRFFTSKRRPLHCKETPSSNWEGRFLFFPLLFPCLLTAVFFSSRWFVLLKLLAPFVVYCTASKLSCKSFPREHSCTSWLFSNLLLLVNSYSLRRLIILLYIWGSNCFI